MKKIKLKKAYRGMYACHSPICDKDKKGLVVPITNAIIYPQTVMILHPI